MEKKVEQDKAISLSENARKTWSKLLISLFAAVLLLVMTYAYRVAHKKDVEQKPAANDLIAQYRQQLAELKQKAESGQPHDLQNYAVAQYATGDIEGAEQTYKKQLATGGDNAMAHNNLANALRDQKDFDEAIVEYQKAITAAPKALTSYVNLGGLYQYNLGEMDKALDVYKKGLTENPEAVDLDVLMAMIYEQKKDKGNAKKYFDKALESQPDNAAAMAGIERLNKAE